jgi:hypothetical protein
MTDFKTADEGGRALFQVTARAEGMAQQEDSLESGYARLGYMLLEVSEMQYWRVQHNTFRDYLKAVAMVSRKTPAQLMQYFLTVRDLLDTFNVTQLETMGITKAIRLRAAKDYLLVIPEEVIGAALDPNVTVKELKDMVSKLMGAPEEEGDWMDLEMEFMVTPEQRAFAENVINVAMHTDPLTKSTISKSAQMWDVFEKLGMEFLGAHSGDGQ